MYKFAKPIFLICESSLHVGSGNEVGLIDLPIQREKHTGFPKIESSSLKGALREFFEFQTPIETNIQDRIKIHLLFGYDDDSLDEDKEEIKKVFKENKTDSFAGAIGFSDARLLLFPVRSAQGVFAWITCPFVINRFINEMKLCKINNVPTVREISICQTNNITVSKKVILEEYSYELKTSEEVTKFAEWVSKNVVPKSEEYNCIRNKIKKDVVVLSNDDFIEFVTHSTEVVTRTKIDNETGTVKEGALFTEEYLPQDSILYSLAFFSKPFQNYNSEKEQFKNLIPNEESAFEFFQSKVQGSPVFQAGGNTTLGKGLLRIQLKQEEKK